MTMHYYIDGYNLLFRITQAGMDFAKKRKNLIVLLNERAGLLKLNITLIFDAQYQTDELLRTHYHHLEILFTNYNETADERLIEEIQREASPQQVTLVTSDNLLSWKARRCHVKTETIDEFLSWINRRYKNAKHPTEKPETTRKKSTQKITKKVAPSSKVSAEDCADYYLEQFSKKLEEMPKITRQAIRRPKKVEKSMFDEEGEEPEKETFSDFERWRQIFEQRSKDNDL